MKFAHHRDRSLSWPHDKKLDDVPEYDKATGWVLFKNCVIDRSGRCGGLIDGTPDGASITSLCNWSEDAMDSHGLPVIIGNDNGGEGSPHISEMHGFIDGSVRIIEESATRTAVCDIVITSSRAKREIAVGVQGISRYCGLEVVASESGMRETITMNKAMDHIAILDDPGVDGACLTNARMLVGGAKWSW